MPSKIVTRRNKRFVTGIFKNVNLYISGNASDRYGIGRVFWSTFTHSLFTSIYESYKVRSEGGTDDLGNVFKPLAKSTVASRKGLRRLRGQPSKATNAVLIMRVTDAIFRSLKPTQLSNRAYRPRKNQLAKRVRNKLEVGTLVPYAKFHDSTRPVIPDNHDVWLDRAATKAFEAVIEHIKRNIL